MVFAKIKEYKELRLYDRLTNGKVFMKNSTVERIRRFTEDRDWDQFHSPANIAIT